MMRTLSLAVALAVSLAACKQERATDAPAVAADPAPAMSPTPEPAAPLETGTAAAMPVDADAQASFAGYGDMKLGSTVEEARLAWGGELKGNAPVEGSTCYYLSPKWVEKPSDFGFMMEGGKFVRYEIRTDKEAAPGGGKVGMTTDALQALYNNTLQSAPHKYVEGGKTLSVAASGAAPSKLVFETDAAGKVTSWRVGLTPQVDYVEGCF
jgi:hypothetical protein